MLFLVHAYLPHFRLQSLVYVVVKPLQLVITLVIHEQFLPPVEGVGLLQCSVCDTVYSPHDPSVLWQVGNCSLHPPSTKMNKNDFSKIRGYSLIKIPK